MSTLADRPDLIALLGGITPSRYAALRLREAILDAELPRLASLVAEVHFWRCVLDQGMPASQCPIFRMYRDALAELEAVQAELVSSGAFLAA
jgi:hypothetical protein